MTQPTDQERAEFLKANIRGPFNEELNHREQGIAFAAWQAARRTPVVPSLTLPIQAGKKYLRRDGKRVIAKESHSPWKEQGLILALVIGDGQTWAQVSAETGKYSDADCNEDLVADYIAAAPQPPEGLMSEILTSKTATPVQLLEPVGELHVFKAKAGNGEVTMGLLRINDANAEKQPLGYHNVLTEHQVRQLLAAQAKQDTKP